MSAENEQQTDVNFLFISENAEIVRIPAHRSVLAASSDVYGAMFYGPMNENGDMMNFVLFWFRCFGYSTITNNHGMNERRKLPINRNVIISVDNLAGYAMP